MALIKCSLCLYSIFFHLITVNGSPQSIAAFTKPNTEIAWGAYIARLISTWRKVCLTPIYCSFIWFNYVRIINQNKYFWFVYKFKIKFVFIMCCIRLHFDSRVIVILLPVETVSMTLCFSRTFILNLPSFKIRTEIPDSRRVDTILW